MSTPVSSNLSPKVMNGMVLSGGITVAQAPFMTALNRISTVACAENLSMGQAARRIYRGEIGIGTAVRRSVAHFFVGMSPYFAKELSRLPFKTYVLVALKPYLDETFPNAPLVSDLFFASALTGFEMTLTPLDTIRVNLQAGKKIKVLRLYDGAMANGVRQFGIWIMFPGADRLWTHQLQRWTSIDPHSLSGIVLKSAPQTCQITALVWLIERLKNEVQLNEEKKEGSRYVNAFKAILQTGPKGFLRGLPPRLIGNYLATIGSQLLLAYGRRNSNG